jgi:RNA polymerase sigma factor, sigma-70 family
MDNNLEDLFIRILNENKNKILRICRIYAHNIHAREDLFQEVCINIWRSLPSFRGESSINTWMYRITLNVCMQFSVLDKKKAKPNSLDGIEIEVVDTPVDETIEKLYASISQLNEAEKPLIQLYLDDLPYKEISKIMGISENLVAVKINRIKNKLSNLLNGKRHE